MTQPIQTRRFREALARVQDLFANKPGVKLTTAEAARMAGLDRQVCRVLFRTLIDTGFLEQGVRGMFSAAHRIPSNRGLPSRFVAEGKQLTGKTIGIASTSTKTQRGVG
jgi:hypothetical protein